MPLNPYTGTLNDPIMEAQHQQTGKDWEKYFRLLNAQLGGRLPRMGAQGPGGPVSLGGAGRTDRGSGSRSLAGEEERIGDEDVLRTNSINAYLGELTDEKKLRAQAELDMAAHNQAVDAQSAGRQAAERGLAIANDPGTSAFGAPIVGGNGTYQTGAPVGQPPVNRQAVAAQMAPGQIAPPAPVAAKPVTFSNPETMLVDGKRTSVRFGSDGLTYDMARRKLDPAAIAPLPDKPTGGLETIVGPDGRPIRVRQEDAIGKEPAAGTMKASTGVQKRVLSFFNRAQQADGELEGMEAQIQKLGLADQGRLALAPNIFQTQLGQSYGAAQRAFTEARLRKDSGAAIPEQEFDNDRKTYFAQPGDSATTLEQKRRARGAILASLGFESGQALGEFVGDENEAKALVQSFKDRASGKKKDASPPAPGGTVMLMAPDGSTRPVQADQVEHYLSLGAKRVQ